MAATRECSGDGHAATTIGLRPSDLQNPFGQNDDYDQGDSDSVPNHSSFAGLLLFLHVRLATSG
jgi:hypothetical protein